MMACGRDSEGSASSVEFVGIESSLLSSNQYLLWDDKQSLFKWKGSLTQLQEFCFKDLNLEVSTTASTSERSSTLKSKTITLVLFNSTGTLQVQGPEAKTLKAKLKKLLQLPVDDDSVILVREEEANTPAFNKNGAKSVQQELDFLKSEVLNLWAHVKEKPQEEDLRSENSRLRETILSLKEENKKLVQERDSLNFALQIVSREAAAQCLPTNNTSNERTIVPNLDEPTPCTNKPQDSIVKSKKKRKKSKNKGGLNNTPEGKESEPTKTDPKQPKERTTLLIGDSMISRIPGRDLGKAVGHRVIVKPFSGATTKAMNHYLKPSLEFSPNEVILHIGTNDLKTREPKTVAESIVDLARQIESTCDTTVTLSELVCRKDKLDQAVKTANKHLKKFCHQNGWKLIHHENISYNGLNKGGLHLNSKANQVCYGKYGCFNNSQSIWSFFVHLPQKPSDIGTTFHLFTRASPQSSAIIDDNSTTTLRASNFNISRRSIFVIHGFQGSINTWATPMKTALLDREDCNVILVDWSKGARFPYGQAAGNARLVGAQTAELIRFLNSSSSGSSSLAKKFYIVGYSLGAHVAGYTGSYLLARGMKLGRITGLDPVGLLFTNVDSADRLDQSDADYVDVIHTDAGAFGVSYNVGHIDFYPNGGSTQPGCRFNIFRPVSSVTCDHLRAPEYYTASVRNLCSWKAYPCQDYRQFVQRNCLTCNGGCPSMGFDADRTNQNGTFYIETNRKAPFCGKTPR